MLLNFLPCIVHITFYVSSATIHFFSRLVVVLYLKTIKKKITKFLANKTKQFYSSVQYMTNVPLLPTTYLKSMTSVITCIDSRSLVSNCIQNLTGMGVIYETLQVK